MSRVRHLRRLALYRVALVCAVAVTLLVSRSEAINVARVSLSHRAAVQSQPNHIRRQSLDQDAGYDFSLLIRDVSLFAPAISFLCRPGTDDSPPPFHPDSYLHNRPPPLS